MSESSTQPPQHYPIEKPITSEFINEWWFLLVAIASIVAYLVRLEVGVNVNRESVKRINEVDLPLIRQNTNIHDAEVEAKLAANRLSFSSEIQSALVGQREFIASQIALVLEKLNTRDNQMQNLKEQTDRQGLEIRKLAQDLYDQTHNPK